ncbi:MAG: BlaI/MecI/CopY family transcriptional regulator [Myxococcota bacterium]
MSDEPERSEFHVPRLGPLEIAVLDRLWDEGELDVQSAHRLVGASRGLARSTLHSTLERLVRKGLASRHKRGRAYAYRPVVTRREWITRALRHVLESIPGSRGAPALLSFVELADRAGEDSLEALEALVRQRRRERAEAEE